MRQLTLNFEPGISARHRSLLDCIATGVYARGSSAVAARLDMSPSHLSEQLAGGGDRNRKFGVLELEEYIEKFKDLTPIFYLVDKFCQDPAVLEVEATHRVQTLLSQLAPAMEQAGLLPTTKRNRVRGV